MASLKERLEQLTDDERAELIEALDIKPKKKDNGGKDDDIATTIQDIIGRLTKLEKGTKKPVVKQSWFDEWWGGKRDA